MSLPPSPFQSPNTDVQPGVSKRVSPVSSIPCPGTIVVKIPAAILVYTDLVPGCITIPITYDRYPAGCSESIHFVNAGIPYSISIIVKVPCTVLVDSYVAPAISIPVTQH